MQKIETSSAIIHRVSPDLVICRYKPNVVVDVNAVSENLEARLSFEGREPYAVIGVFPEDVRFDMTMLENDHYTKIALNQITRVLAIVAEGILFDPIAKLYFAYYPTKFSSKVFRREADAHIWVLDHIQRIKKEES